MKKLFVFLVSIMMLSLVLADLISKDYAVFETSEGDIVCELYSEQAPETVKNFIGLATGTKSWVDIMSGEEKNMPLYDNTIFHRVIPDFMIQGGDPLGTGRGNPGYFFKDEFSDDLKFDIPGRLAMANSGPNTNGCQFFITVKPTSWLNNRHTIFGQVIEGQEVVDKISLMPKDQSNKPLEKVIIKTIRIIKK